MKSSIIKGALALVISLGLSTTAMAITKDECYANFEKSRQEVDQDVGVVDVRPAILKQFIAGIRKLPKALADESLASDLEKADRFFFTRPQARGGVEVVQVVVLHPGEECGGVVYTIPMKTFKTIVTLATGAEQEANGAQ
jgi:hypothetical protein